MDTFYFFDYYLLHYRQYRNLFEVDGLYRREIDEVEMESIKFSFTDFFVKFFGDEYPEFFLSWEKIALFLFFVLNLIK